KERSENMTSHSKQLKATIKIIAAILCCCLLTGCKPNYKKFFETVSQIVNKESNTNSVEAEIGYDPWQYAVDKWNEVLDKMEAKDVDGIYDMFSEYDQKNIPDLTAQIEGLVNYLDGEVVSKRHVGASNQYSRVRDGIVKEAAYTAQSYITTSNDTTYWVRIRVITAADDESKIGFSGISLLNSNLQTVYFDLLDEWRENGAKRNDEPDKPEGMRYKINY
ncbi:MAG: DUF5104 domain-containing protein, partial [Oscillospiraceae bacterium]